MRTGKNPPGSHTVSAKNGLPVLLQGRMQAGGPLPPVYPFRSVPSAARRECVPVFPFPAKTVTDAAITSSLPDPAVPAPYETRQEVSCGTFRKYAGKSDARHQPDILSCVFVR